MGLVLAFVGLVALAAVVAAFVARSRAKPRATAPRAPRDPFAADGETGGDPRTLKAGDMVEYLGERLFVRGSLRLTEGGFSWSEHFVDPMNVDDGGADAESGHRWISVEEDPDLEVMLWSEYRGEAELLPNQKTLTVDGITYHRSEHGTANYRSEGTTGLGATGRVEYADFDGPGGRGLAFERFLGAQGRGRWEVSLGERVPRGTLTIYPGSGPEGHPGGGA
ncbi:DUF4178 domain-containing protein [Streptomyces sp. 3MP-14]|uniref:DUF4178 domain-containing protein n=1 Tax=Streptomyces mimosae TaxID=2586635 RepID=A0A5N6APL3_9ACTN|nr:MULTISPECIES: DUF4178 domain-containing protein [Streptomyces]KAB8169850.1 DUF4178 domain-containing protein [Streptomyces mimosae]KAB8178598.1 DUF4178 domain-containing protein [Streptomyces sp. 3MP-14]